MVKNYKKKIRRRRRTRENEKKYKIIIIYHLLENRYTFRYNLLKVRLRKSQLIGIVLNQSNEKKS